MSNGLRIVQFTAENVKRLKLVSITPKGHLVPITGRNGQGKTTVLDAIWWALGGKENITAVPVRKGADKGVITLDLGDFVVERTFTTKKKCSLCKGTGKSAMKPRSEGMTTALETPPCGDCGGSGFIAENGTEVSVRAPSAVAGQKGPVYGSPQAMLDALVGSLSFDPLVFARAAGAEQFSILRKTVDVAFDFDAATKANQEDYQERTRVNRAAKEQRTLAAGITVVDGLPDAAIDEDKAQADLRAGYEANSQLSIQRESRKRESERIEGIESNIPKARERAEALRKQAAEVDRETDALQSSLAEQRKILNDLPALPDQVDVDALNRSLQDAKRVNLAIQRRDAKTKAVGDAEAHEARSKELAGAMEARDKAKQDAVSAAKMPVAGLGFGDGCVTLNGLPFEQASDAERLRVSVAIAMATNPKLRVIRIRDGSLLDNDSMKLLADMAKAGDYQFWCEIVGDGKLGIVLEDGEVKADHQEEETIGTSKS